MSIRSVHDLQQRRQEHKQNSHEIYRSILRDIYKTIEERDVAGKRNMVYRVPVIVYGNTRYRVSTAVCYIIQQLSKGGFIVFPHENNLLYIDWSIPVVPQQNKPLLTLKSCLRK